MKGIFFHRFDIAVDAEPLELKNTFMCQLWHGGRLRVEIPENQLKLRIDCFSRQKMFFKSQADLLWCESAASEEDSLVSTLVFHVTLKHSNFSQLLFETLKLLYQKQRP